MRLYTNQYDTKSATYMVMRLELVLFALHMVNLTAMWVFEEKHA